MSASLGHLTIDTTDLDRAIGFWSEVFTAEVWRAPDGAIAVLSCDGMLDLTLQRVDALPSGKNPVHLDLFTADLDAEVARLTALGARLQETHDAHGTTWATMTDPDGLVFDVVLHAERN
ncbi:MAG: VOC family protein [Geodermatophilaceae bacterium]|nr:VOC family protein [Geodermatophilaceae bacterium]MDQ3464649.1 VOC family protein [Actinomycetota bacterium]